MISPGLIGIATGALNFGFGARVAVAARHRWPTGASSGIGAATARALAAQGAGVVLAARREDPLIDNGGAAIVNTASVGGLVGVPNLAAYVASKHAVVGLTKSVALEYAEQNIRVNAIAPGSTDTEMLASADDEHRAALAGLAPMNRISDPTEIAAAIIYLLADATYSTGVTLAADGGQSVP